MRRWRPTPTSTGAAGTTRWCPRICTSRPGRSSWNTWGWTKTKYVVIFCTPRRAEALKAQLKPGKLSQPVEPGHRPAAGCQGLGRRPQGAAQRRPLPDRWRDGQACLPRLGHLGQGAGQIRGRHARDRQRHRVCRGAAADPAVRKGRFPGAPSPRTPASAEQPAVAEILYHDDLEKYSGRELLDELRQTLIGRGVRVPTVEGARPFVNLDNAASTPTFAPIWNAVCQTWRQPGAGAAGDHSGGQVHLRRGAGRAFGRL